MQILSKCRYLAVTLVLQCFSTTIVAQDLAGYVVDAVDANPRVLEKIHVFRQALRDRDAAKSGWKPSVDLQGNVGYTFSDTLTNNSQRDNYDSNSIELALTQNLFNGFETEHRVKQAEARVNAALFDLYDTMDNVALEAVQAYIEVIKQKRLFELAQENVLVHEETLRQIRVRDESGAGRRSELEQTEGRVARAYASLIAQRNNLDDAISQLHEILGRYIDIEEFIDPELPAFAQPNIDSAIDRALIEHPAIKVARYNVEAARYDHKRAKSAYLPSVDLRVAQEVSENIDDSGDNDDELTVSLNLTYNLYRGGADRAERQRRMSQVGEEQQFGARVRRQVINTLRLAWQADTLLQKQLGYLEQHVARSRDTYISYQEEFSVGERDLIDLLDVQNELNTAQNNYTDAFYDASAARYRTYEGVGNLFAPMGIDVVVDGQDVRLARIQASGIDLIPAENQLDLDGDGVIDSIDQCDNSAAGQAVDQYGCTEKSELPLYRLNSAPAAVDDEITVGLNGAKEIPRSVLLSNDNDRDRDQLELVNFTQPESGKIALSPSGEIVYRAADGFIGVDQFSYTIADPSGANSTATVKVFVPETIATDETQFVNFVYGKTELTSASKHLVSLVAAHLKDNPGLDVKLLTHTDSNGSSDFNMQLSERRAASLLNDLIELGVEGERVFVKAYGELSPITENDTEEGRAINRRGEFVFSPRIN